MDKGKRLRSSGLVGAFVLLLAMVPGQYLAMSGAAVAAQGRGSTGAVRPTPRHRNPAATGRASESAAPSLQTVIARSRPAVVVVTATTGVSRTSLGSGFCVDSVGIIATNAHVIRGATSVVVRIGDLGVTASARPIYYDAGQDIALLYVPAAANGVVLKLRSTLELVQGVRVLAIGHPEGLDFSVSDGIVSALRSLDSGRQLIQITAPISPGSSGGPILDERGRVVGMAVSQLREGQNLNFAIPAEQVAYALNSCRAGLQSVLNDESALDAFAKQVLDHASPRGIDLLEARFNGEDLFALSRNDLESMLGPPTVVGGLKIIGEGARQMYAGAFMYYASLGLMFQCNHPAKDPNQTCTGVYIYLLNIPETDPRVQVHAYTGPMTPEVRGGWTRDMAMNAFHDRGPVDMYDPAEVAKIIQLVQESKQLGVATDDDYQLLEQYFQMAVYTSWGNILLKYLPKEPHYLTKVLVSGRR